ncbi:MAG: GNAT family N-acetyltransferase [Dehalococcoidia bacterium]
MTTPTPEPAATRPALALRRATPDDLPVLVPLINAAYRKTEGHVFRTTSRTDRDDLAQRLSGLVVAEVDGRVAGCIHIDLSGEHAHYGLLAVDVARHGHGIGSMLIEHAEQAGWAAGHTVVRIEAVKEAGYIPFYERRGYRVMAETDGQVWNGGADWGAVILWHMTDMEKVLR